MSLVPHALGLLCIAAGAGFFVAGTVGCSASRIRSAGCMP